MPVDTYTQFTIERGNSEFGPFSTIATLTDKTTTTAAFLVPALGAQVTVNVVSSTWMTVGERVNIVTGGHYKVISKPTATSAVLEYVNRTTNTHTGKTIVSGVQVLPGSYVDPTIPNPTLAYLVKGFTDAGLEIPYNIQSITIAVPQQFQWAWRMGGATTGATAGVFGVVADSTGDVICTGNFVGQINFTAQQTVGSGTPAPPANNTLTGTNDIFVAKYSSSGGFRWVKKFGSTGTDIGYGVAVDSLDNIYVTGVYTGAIDFGTGTVPNPGSSGMFLMKMNSDGIVQWVRGFGTDFADNALTIGVDSANNVIIAGFIGNPLGGTCNFNPVGPGFESPGAAVNVTAPSSKAIVVAKFNSSGVTQWARGYGGNSINDQAVRLAVDRADNSVYIAGSFGGTVDFGGTMLTAEGSDGFVLKLNSAGTRIFAKQVAADIDERIAGIAVGPNGIWGLVGVFRGTIDFGNGTGELFYSGRDHFVAMFNSSGLCLWSKHYGPYNTSENESINAAMDSIGNLIEVGAFSGAFSIDGVWTFPAGGTLDICMVKFSASGTMLWTYRPPQGASYNKVQGVWFDQNRNLIAGGFFSQSCDFGGGNMAVAPGGSNAWVAKFSS